MCPAWINALVLGRRCRAVFTIYRDSVVLTSYGYYLLQLRFGIDIEMKLPLLIYRSGAIGSELSDLFPFLPCN